MQDCLLFDFQLIISLEVNFKDDGEVSLTPDNSKESWEKFLAAFLR